MANFTDFQLFATNQTKVIEIAQQVLLQIQLKLQLLMTLEVSKLFNP